MSAKQKMTDVTKKAPCEVCEGDHKCARGDRGLLLCGRRDGPVAGFRHLGASKGDPKFHLYRREGDDPPAAAPTKKSGPKPPRDWGAVAGKYARDFTAEARDELAARLALPATVFAALPLLGVSARGDTGRTFTFPECDAAGRVVGITERIPGADGKDAKKMKAGGSRGLTIPDGWRERPGPALLVEGASDTLALTSAGLSAVGRPSNTGGVGHLAALLAEWPADRDVLVVGENDREEDGAWPGREGAHRTAASLRARLGRPVLVTTPPDGAKDVRQWLITRAGTGGDWAALGRELLVHLTASAEAPVGTCRPEIVVSTEEHAVNDAAVTSLPAADGVYQRGGLLVHVLQLDAHTPSAAVIRQPAGATVVRELTPPLLREQFTRVADWVKMVPKGEGEFEKVPAHPPAWCVQAVHARGAWPGVPHLEAVVTHPILLPDGSLLAQDGYHRPTGVLVRLPRGLRLSVPDSPSNADAVSAAELLFDAVCDFPFERPEHRAGWLAGLFSPLAWFAFDGPAPFFLIDGNVRGVGKGLLADAIAIPVLGRRFSAMTYTPDRDELRKRITSVAAEGERMVLLDNLAGAVGNDQLDAALTADRWKDRLLGGNRVFDGPLNVCWYATGNNCELRADTSRRTCHVRLESPAERPEERGGFRHPHLRHYLRRHRDQLLSAALTILRGWVAAGRPRHELTPWGSYESWSEVVREAVVWAGQPDPALTRVALQTAADRNAIAMTALLGALRRIDPDRQGLTASEVVEAAKTHPDLRAAVEDLAGRLDTRPLGYALRSFARRNFDGLFLDNAATTGGGVRWAAYPLAEFHSRRGTSPPSPPDAGESRGDGGDGGDGSAGGSLFSSRATNLPD